MLNHENYWILRGINSFGQYQSRKIAEAEGFFLEHFDRQIEPRKIQYRLFSWYQDDGQEKQPKAEICLRCFTSNCIYQFCLSTEKNIEKLMA